MPEAIGRPEIFPGHNTPGQRLYTMLFTKRSLMATEPWLTLPRRWAHLGLVLHWKIQFELCRQLIFRVEPVGEVNPPDATVGVDLQRQG